MLEKPLRKVFAKGGYAEKIFTPIFFGVFAITLIVMYVSKKNELVVNATETPLPQVVQLSTTTCEIEYGYVGKGKGQLIEALIDGHNVPRKADCTANFTHQDSSDANLYNGDSVCCTYFSTP